VQFCRSCAAAKFFNSLLCGISGWLNRIVHTDIALSASHKKCWTAEFMKACEGLRASDRYTDCVNVAIPLPLQDFVVDQCEQLRAEWRELDGIDPITRAHKLTNWLLIMHGWPRLSSKVSQGALPRGCHRQYCLYTYSWN